MKKVEESSSQTSAAHDKQQTNAEGITARAIRRIENKAQPALAKKS